MNVRTTMGALVCEMLMRLFSGLGSLRTRDVEYRGSREHGDPRSLKSLQGHLTVQARRSPGRYRPACYRGQRWDNYNIRILHV